LPRHAAAAPPPPRRWHIGAELGGHLLRRRSHRGAGLTACLKIHDRGIRTDQAMDLATQATDPTTQPVDPAEELLGL